MNPFWLCAKCGAWYHIEPTGNHEEWRVTLATGQTARRLVPQVNNLQEAVDYVLGGKTEPQWYIADFVPIQIQACPRPLCMTANCLGELEETYILTGEIK